MKTSNLTSKGQVTIPVDVRRQLGLKPGDKVGFVRHGKRVSIEAVIEPSIGSVFGLLTAPRGRGVADIDEALADTTRFDGRRAAR